MITLLDTIGPAVWHASWQAAGLALVIALVLRGFGARLSPRWRYFFWCIVVVRLVFVATPASPWSVFNLVPWNAASGGPPIARHEFDPKIAPPPYGAESASPPAVRSPDNEAGPPSIRNSAPERPAEKLSATAATPISHSAALEAARPTIGGIRVALIARILSAVWFVGCIAFALQLVATALILHRRLSACRPVTDASILKVLEAIRAQMGLKQSPALLVTPESLSPCFVGTWNPRILVPESLLTESSTGSLRHVLAHELAHLARGDLWTNWLLLAVRILHWFNPVAWWTIRQMHAEREAACDELALAALGEEQRSGYAGTILDLAANLAPPAMAPGMIGLFSSTRRLRARVERLVRSSSARALRTRSAAGLLLGIALLGLTDAMPGAMAKQPETAAAPVAAKSEGTPAKSRATVEYTYEIRGRCIDLTNRSALGGVRVRLFKVSGRTLPIFNFAETVSDGDGRFEFTGLVPPKPHDRFDRLLYLVAVLSDGHPIQILIVGHQPGREAQNLVIRMAREESKLSGRVVNGRGQPVAGAIVTTYEIDGRPVPDLLSATTDADGRFAIDKLYNFTRRGGGGSGATFHVIHPNYPDTIGHASALPADVAITLPDGCTIAGQVTDAVTGQPAAGTLITGERLDPRAWTEFVASTDATGHFRMVVPEGRYNFLAEARDRVCVATTGRECLDGAKVDLPLRLIGGGFISGQVVNTTTGLPVSFSESGQPISIGLFGPSRPPGQVISPAPAATVDHAGRFKLRAAPGENFPYFVNTRGERMAWDTRQQPPIVVKEGQTTTYNMLITPEVSPERKLREARRVVAALPKEPAERAARILVEFRKLGHTVDETELWCTLMRELVAIGRMAVPQICDELDRTTADRTLRRLAFALRAIGDPRAVPALVRAIPRTLVPPSSDYGLIVNDKDLSAFMQRHGLGKSGGVYFDFERPPREVVGALHKLTGQNFNDSELFGISLSEDPRRQMLQRRLYRRQAQQWQTWWEAHWRERTDDRAYQNVNFPVAEEALAPTTEALSRNARLGEGMSGAVLSPASQGGRYTVHFYDLDTGYEPRWPAHIPRDEAKLDWKQLADWAAKNGVDLMCVTHRAPDGTETFVLRSFDMQAWEISRRDLRNIDRVIAAGTLPQGRAVGEFLMHYDDQSRQLVADANGAFIFVTREGSRGVIETTDRITRTADITGMFQNPPHVGFHKGVQFDLKPIIP